MWRFIGVALCCLVLFFFPYEAQSQRQRFHHESTASRQDHHDLSSLFRSDTGVITSMRPPLHSQNKGDHTYHTCATKEEEELSASKSILLGSERKFHQSTGSSNEIDTTALDSEQEMSSHIPFSITHENWQSYLPPMDVDDDSITSRKKANIELAASASSDIELIVDNVYDDYNPNSQYCSSTPVVTGRCNLRSAWLNCMSITSTLCRIILPENSRVYVNMTYAALILQSTANVELIGQNTIINRVGQSVNSQAQLVHNSSFPRYTPLMTNTQSATINYNTSCLTGCPGQQLNVSTCYPKTVGDTVIRLYQGPVEIAVSDDSCGSKSQITYDIPLSGTCKQYCVHLGCFFNGACQVYATASIAPSTMPQFILYNQGGATSVPSLVLFNMTIGAFGSSTNIGGALSLTGDIDLDISYVYFTENSASMGAAIYLADNSIRTHIAYCIFTHNFMTGVYFDGNTTNTVIEHIISSDFITFGGSQVHKNIVIRDWSMYSNRITIGGASSRNITISDIVYYSVGYTFLYLQQKVSSASVSNIVVRPYPADVLLPGDDDQFFYQTYADPVRTLSDIDIMGSSKFSTGTFTPNMNTFNIGAGSNNLYFNNITVTCNNVNVNVNGNNHGDNNANDDDSSDDYFHQANIMLMNSAKSVYVDSMTIQDCHIPQETYGGMIAIISSSQVVLDQISVSNVASNLAGGGIYLQRSTSVTIQNSTLSYCQSKDSGGAITMYNGNSDIEIVNTMITESSATNFGGGIFLGSENDYVTIAGCNLTNNEAGQSGGAIFVTQSNYQFAVLDLLAYKKFAILQTAHPYVVPDTYQGFTTEDNTIIYSESVEVPAATHFVINFDKETQFQDGFILSIIDRVSGATLYSCDSSDKLPGVSIPSISIFTNFVMLTLSVPEDKTLVTTGLYGFKAYLYPVIPNSQTKPAIIANNHATKAGGMLLYYANQFSVMVNVNVTNNTALSGGGIVYQNGNVGASFHQVYLTFNHAEAYGGGMVIQSGQFGMSFYDCLFHSNSVEKNGGGIFFGSSNGVGVLLQGNAILFSSVRFVNNTGWIGGGAISASDDDTMLFNDCSFDLNSAEQGDGGALYLGQACYVNFTGTTSFGYNWAIFHGGAIHSNQGNVITLSGDVTVESCYTGYGGGGMSIFNSSVLALKLADVKFQYNYAYFGGGGALAFSSSPVYVMLDHASTMEFYFNYAPRGSAIFIYDLLWYAGDVVFKNEIRNTSFMHNFASTGGTIFWIYDSYWWFWNQAPIIDSPSNTWQDNRAGYGPKMATQAVYLFSPKQYDVVVYGQNLVPSINITLYDYYYQQVNVTGDTAISATITKFNCSSYYPFLSGSDLSDNGVPMNYSVASFKHLQATCAPNGWIQVEFTAQLGVLSYYQSSSVSRVIHSFYIKNTTMMNFRGCVAGEFETKGNCQVCQLSTFNLLPNSQSCTSCTTIEGVESCEGNEIVLKQGYWRRYETSAAVQACLLDPISCEGGTDVGETSCGHGYEGPLCAVCSLGFYFNNNQCLECTASTQITPAVIALMVIVFVALIFAILLYRALQRLEKKHAPKPDGEDEDGEDNLGGARPLPQASSGNSDDSPSTIALIYWWMREKYDDIIVRLKIVVSTFQVIASTASVFSISYPASFSKFTSGIKFFNIGFDNLVPVGCTGDYNFVTTILTTTLGPILISFLLLIAFIGEFLWVRHKIQKMKKRTKGMKKKAFHETKSKYLNYFFYLTYLVLPSVTTTLFQWFICTNVDPENEDNDHYDLYLTADMSISCQSNYYHQWSIYVILMILLYPVGIPSLYLYLLYCNKEEIMNRDNKNDEEDEKERDGKSLQYEIHLRASSISGKSQDPSEAIAREVDEELGRRKNMSFSFSSRPTESEESSKEVENKKEGELSASAQRLSFLWQAYEPKFWYWEVIETTRKLMLTAVLSVCAPGSSEQSVLGVLMSYVYIRMYSYYRPYEEDADDVLAETGQVQILMTFFVTLVITNNLLSSKWDYGLGCLLTLINLGIIVLTFYYEVSNYQAAVKEAKEKEDKIRQLREQKRAQKRLEFAYKAGGLAPPGVNATGSTNGGAATVQFKKMNAKELQSMDEVQIKQLRGKSAVDSDDEEDAMTTNIMHRNHQKPVTASRGGDIELQSMKPPTAMRVSEAVDSDDED